MTAINTLPDTVVFEPAQIIRREGRKHLVRVLKDNTKLVVEVMCVKKKAFGPNSGDIVEVAFNTKKQCYTGGALFY